MGTSPPASSLTRIGVCRTRRAELAVVRMCTEGKGFAGAVACGTVLLPPMPPSTSAAPREDPIVAPEPGPRPAAPGVGSRAWGVVKEGARALWGSGEPRQPALDVLRAASILAVFAQHWPSRFYTGGGVDVGLDGVPPFSVGFAGVDMFFVLSGFLIGRQLWKEMAADGTILLRRFFLRRTLRIWPYYYFALLVWTLFHPVENGPARLCELTFWANYTDIRGIPGSWSLSTEEQFYIVAPLLLLVFGRRIKLRTFFVVFGVLEVACILARYQEVGRLVALGKKVEYFEPVHLHCDGLVAGMALSLASVLRPEWFVSSRAPSGLGRAGLLPASPALRADDSASTFRAGKNAVRGWVFFAACCVVGVVLYKVERKVYNLASLAIMFTGLTYALLQSGRILQKIMSWRAFQIVSMLSYGMYLNHFLFMTEIGRWWGGVTRDALSPRVAFFLGFALATVACTAVAAVTYILIEHPFLVLRDSILRRPSFQSARKRPAAAA